MAMDNQNIAPAIHERKGHTPSNSAMKSVVRWAGAIHPGGPLGAEILAHAFDDHLKQCGHVEMLEALKRVADAYGFDPSIDSSIWQEVFAAITKAEG